MPVSANVPWVVLDSTALSKHDRYLDSVAGQQLIAASAAGRVHLVVPEVVVLECIANHERDARTAADKLRAAQEELYALRAKPADIAPLRLDYRADLERVLREANAEVLPIPDVPHARLVEKATQRRRPFDKDGDGYRDALVWETVLELVRISTDSVVLISNDRHAFPDEKDTESLSRELAAEVEALGSPASVELFFTIRAFVDTYIPTSAKVAGEWRQRLDRDDVFRDQLVAAMLKVADRDAARLIFEDLGLWVRNARFLRFSDPRELRVGEAIATDQASLVEVSIVVDYLLEADTAVGTGLVTTGPSVTVSVTAPPVSQYQTLRETGELELIFEIAQHKRKKAEFDEPRLVGWTWNARRF